MNNFLTPLPAVPSFLRLRIFLILSSGLSVAAFSMPLRLSLMFSGSISANGPTTALESTTEGTVASLPPENQLLERNSVLFRFQQPVLAADLEVLRVKESGLARRLAEAQNQCTILLRSAKRNLANAQETYAMYEKAYVQQAISEVALLGHRDMMNDAERQLESQQSQCQRDVSSLQSDLDITREQITKQRSASQFQQELRAPDRGSVHSLIVKTGQRVVKGQILGQFTAVGSTGAQLRIPVQDRPFVTIGDLYTVYSQAYAFLVNPPERHCKITSITPDVVVDGEMSGSGFRAPAFHAMCQFERSPLEGFYPLLVGMQVDAYGTSVEASLMQLLLRGYRELVIPKPRAQPITTSN